MNDTITSDKEPTTDMVVKDISLSSIGQHTQKSKEINIEATVITVSNN